MFGIDKLQVRASFRLSAALFLACGALVGGISGSFSLAALAQNADLIVVGTTGPVAATASGVGISLAVDRVVKGSAAAGSSLSVAWALPDPATAAAVTASMTTPQTGIWFLRSSGSGWSVVPVRQGLSAAGKAFIPTPSRPIPEAYAYAANAAVTDRVASEVAAALESVNGGGTDLGFLHFGLLDQLQSPVIRTLYQRMAASTDVRQQILGRSGLIRQGDATSLAAAAGAGAKFSAYPVETAVLLWSIQNEYRPVEPAAVTALGQLAANQAAGAALRQAAAHALASVHSQTALPFLAMLLDDGDANLRAEAVGGMGAFANGLPVQTSASVPGLTYLQPAGIAPYKTSDTMAHFAMGRQAISRDEVGYIAYWKGWWQQHRASLGF